MPKQVINNVAGATPPLPVFSHAVISNGNVYVSGSIGSDEEYNIVGGVQQQARAALDNMKAILEGAGSGLEHIVKVTIYLTNMARDFGIFNEVYAEFFRDVGALPARTCIGVAALPMGAFVEVECIAELAPGDEE
ncbi:YjgF-like protein [Boletus edulis BED1]|uniref:YjgF-like protein n=1 Tax=Boletus edulis BED1 TaxID=1328754 RepID=A0AAD4C5K2_BOLED|nr:YjgF-like protein [Boletus edulis BED1]